MSQSNGGPQYRFGLDATAFAHNADGKYGSGEDEECIRKLN